MGELRLGVQSADGVGGGATVGWSLAAWRVYNQRAAGGGLWALVGVGGGKVAGGWPTLGMQIGQKVQLEKAELSLAGHGPRGRRKLDATEVTELARTSKLNQEETSPPPAMSCRRPLLANLSIALNVEEHGFRY